MVLQVPYPMSMRDRPAIAAGADASAQTFPPLESLSCPAAFFSLSETSLSLEDVI